ncbi:MAG TPA: methylmalonyl-CoA mutase subunit beta [Dermatophilaceae bacterium]|nr:methylmalonyl-CoA mutase subunit beta [Dermatophilaceae bacterium]
MTATPDQGERMALAADFPPRAKEDWRRLAAAVVNKSRPEDDRLDPEAAEAALRTALPGGLVVDPLYLEPDPARPLGVPGAMPFTRGLGLRPADRPWDVRQLHDHPDPETTRAAVLDDLERGGTSVWLHVGADGLAAGHVAEALTDVRADLAPIVVSSWDDQQGAAAALLAALDGVPDATGSLGHDPLGAAARLGGSPDLGPLAEAAAAVAGRPGLGVATVDTRPYHDAGATTVDEVAFAVATGVAYLRALEDAGVDAGTAVGLLHFRLAATADQFLTAATFRALRRCWARVAELAGVPEPARGARTHAVTSARMFTRDDPFTNVLRSTLAVFGASLGGADAITVLPYDSVAGLPERFSRRLARNTQLVLAEESNVGRVTDPAGGAWYVESLTDDLAARAWGALQEVERAGGMAAALGSGLVAERVAAGAAERAVAVATRRSPITGVSTFPQLTEPPLTRVARAAVPTEAGALAPVRDAEPYEALRDRATAYRLQRGHPPVVVVAALGARRDFAARETFVATLLAAGGIEARTVEGGPAAAAEAASEAGTPVVVLASSPKGYAVHAAEAVAGLRAAGVGRVLVAGRSRELGDAAAPVDGEVRDGLDVVALLGDLLDTLGAPTAPEGEQA